MVEYVIVTASPPEAPAQLSDSNEVGLTGSQAFINPAYLIVETVNPQAANEISDQQEIGLSGDLNFVNPAYIAYSSYPPLGLGSVKSSVPISPRTFGYLTGG